MGRTGLYGGEIRQAQKEGWEIQYRYGRGKEMDLPSSQTRGGERLSRTPKSTRFCRQNPISERWNSDEQLVLWRKAWADTFNRHLEKLGIEARIDHRTLAEQGIPDGTAVHEGVTARAMERGGKISDRCEMNRQIRAGNQVLRTIRRQIEKWEKALQFSIPTVAELLESLRDQMILLQYEIRVNRIRIGNLFQSRAGGLSLLTAYQQVQTQIEEKTLLIEALTGI